MKFEIELSLKNCVLRLSGDYEELEEILPKLEQIIQKIENGGLQKSKSLEQITSNIETTTSIIEYSETDLPIVLHPDLNLKESVLLILYGCKNKDGFSTSDIASSLDLSGTPYSSGGLRKTISNLKKQKFVLTTSETSRTLYRLTLKGIRHSQEILTSLSENEDSP